MLSLLDYYTTIRVLNSLIWGRTEKRGLLFCPFPSSRLEVLLCPSPKCQKIFLSEPELVEHQKREHPEKKERQEEAKVKEANISMYYQFYHGQRVSEEEYLYIVYGQVI